MSGTDDDKFQTALVQVLRPLSRAMIAQSISIAQATELLKQAYVSSVLQNEPEAPTDSRVSLLTGIHRKDVKRLRDADASPPRRSMLNASSLVRAIWTTNPQFLDDRGVPLALPREGSPSLEELIKTARIDLPSATLWTALIEQGMMAHSDKTDLYELIGPDPSHDTASQLMAFEKNVTAHLEAVADNISAQEPRHYERGAHFNQLSDASLASLDAEARVRLQQVLVDLNALALKLQDEDALGDEDHSGRFSIGAYVHGQSPTNGGDKDD